MLHSLLLLLCAACRPPSEAAAACPVDQIADGETCVPAACGLGPWGSLSDQAGALFVDPAASPGGDGSTAWPFDQIQPALDAAGGGLVALAAGQYAEPLALDEGHAGVHLAGRCQELVILDASNVGEDSAGILMELGTGVASLSGFTLRAAPSFALVVRSGHVQVLDVTVEDSAYIGISATSQGLQNTEIKLERVQILDSEAIALFASDPGTTVTLDDSTIHRSTSDQGEPAYGIAVTAGASVVAESLTISSIDSEGLFLNKEGSTLVLRDSLVSGPCAADGPVSAGLVLVEGQANVIASEITCVAGYGLYVTSGASLTLQDSLVQHTQPGGGALGWGVALFDGASLLAEGNTITDNVGFGLYLGGAGTSADLTDSTVQCTHPDQRTGGASGIAAEGGARLYAEAVVIEANAFTGLWAAEPETMVEMYGCQVKDSVADAVGAGGYGIVVGDGASLTAEASAVEAASTIGILASGGDTRLSLREVAIQGTRFGGETTAAIGLLARSGAFVEASELEVSQTAGPGLLSQTGASLSCDTCVISGNQFAGAAVVGAASLSLSATQLSATSPSTNLGGGFGVYAAGEGEQPSLQIQASHVFDNPVAGVWLGSPGSFILSDNELAGGEGEVRGTQTKCGDAVFASGELGSGGGAPGLLMSGNTLSGGRGAGLFLQDADATLSGNVWLDNAVDLVRQGGDCHIAPGGLDQEALAVVELCPPFDYATCTDAFTFYLEVAGLESWSGASAEAEQR